MKIIDFFEILRTWKTTAMISQETGVTQRKVRYYINKIKEQEQVEKKQVNAICPECNRPIYIHRRKRHFAYRLKYLEKPCIFCGRDVGHEKDCPCKIIKGIEL